MSCVICDDVPHHLHLAFQNPRSALGYAISFMQLQERLSSALVSSIYLKPDIKQIFAHLVLLVLLKLFLGKYLSWHIYSSNLHRDCMFAINLNSQW